MSAIAMLREVDGSWAGEASLGSPVPFAWIDVGGVPFVSIEAYVIERGSPDGSAVLVTRATLEVMAAAVELAQLYETAPTSWATELVSLAPDYISPDVGDLYDVTELAGGWGFWESMRLDHATPAPLGCLLALIRDRFADVAAPEVS
jgi:hypothetical protein